MQDQYRGSSRKQAYQQYLQSEHWQVFKLSKILQEDKTCLACNSWEHIQLHHMIYRDRWEDAELEDTVWLCMKCHKIFHLRAGVRIKTKRSWEWLREETKRIILFEPKKKVKTGHKKLSRQERKRIRKEIRMQRKMERRARHLELQAKQAASSRKNKPKPPKQKQKNPYGEFNRLISQVKQGAALRPKGRPTVFYVPPPKKNAEL
jgi:hypothetical protein